MNRRLLLFVIPFVGLCMMGCRSYKVFPDGYLLRGHDYFVSISGKLAVYTGPEFMEDTAWQDGIPPLGVRKLNRRQTKVLKQIGYDPKGYSVVFRSNPHSPINFYAVANNEPVKKEEGKIRLLNTSALEQKTSGQGKWYYSIQQSGGKQFYHAVLPVSERLFAEKYVGLIFPLSGDPADLSTAEQFIADNLYQLHSGGIRHVQNKTVIGVCPDDPGVDYYHGYIIPDEVINNDGYMLLAAYRPQADGKKELIYYRVLDPGLKMGAFRICPGEYMLEYLTLESQIRWSAPFSPIPQKD